MISEMMERWLTFICSAETGPGCCCEAVSGPMSDARTVLGGTIDSNFMSVFARVAIRDGGFVIFSVPFL